MNEYARSTRILSLLISAGAELVTLGIFAVLLATKTLSLMGFILGLALVSRVRGGGPNMTPSS